MPKHRDSKSQQPCPDLGISYSAITVNGKQTISRPSQSVQGPSLWLIPAQPHVFQQARQQRPDRGFAVEHSPPDKQALYASFRI